MQVYYRFFSLEHWFSIPNLSMQIWCSRAILNCYYSWKNLIATSIIHLGMWADLWSFYACNSVISTIAIAIKYSWGKRDDPESGQIIECNNCSIRVYDFRYQMMIIKCSITHKFTYLIKKDSNDTPTQWNKLHGDARTHTWAATVCERVGKSLVMHAVLNPCSDNPIAALRPAPPAPTTTASYVWSTIVYDEPPTFCNDYLNI